jgi:DNA-binding NarL/FixJ family response regulator
MPPIVPDMSTVMLALGLALLVTILLRRSYRYFGRVSRRQTPAIEHVPRPRASTRERLDDAPKDVVRWQVEMHETARDLKAELDTKISVLRQLVLMATEQQEKLEQSIIRAQELGLDRNRDRPASIAGASEQSASLYKRQPTSDDSSLSFGSTAEQFTDRQKHVGRLAREGCSSDEIAQQLGLSLGDVELLLSLHSRD